MARLYPQLVDIHQNDTFWSGCFRIRASRIIKPIWNIELYLLCLHTHTHTHLLTSIECMYNASICVRSLKCYIVDRGELELKCGARLGKCLIVRCAFVERRSVRRFWIGNARQHTFVDFVFTLLSAGIKWQYVFKNKKRAFERSAWMGWEFGLLAFCWRIGDLNEFRQLFVSTNMLKIIVWKTADQ